MYRGKKVPDLQGYYIYGDFVSGRVWGLRYAGQKSPENFLILHNSNLYPSSFGIDEERELYICSFDGSIYRLAGHP